ncbi:Alpha/Beta hydrolase protein [Staphylotrichum tortipilum]|uniref:Alpha/Beta hydrolase protein n=1 Tax=Staphylotrichum tortipilum TaxID=2831512 RepID=A0AAN6MPW3_9PEZI|nr:Alpha/Beta hydrolase protein [Staphylotrichum longicolle]
MADFSAYDGPSSEWLALAATLPSPPLGLSIPELKEATNAGRDAASASAMQTLGPQVQIQDHSIPARDGALIEARTYRRASDSASSSPLPVYIHLHGGGFLFGTLASEDPACARVAITTGALVLNVNYRHTPEHVYPTAWDDVEDAFAWLHANAAALGADPAQVVVGGISAGAYLTASLALRKHLGLAPELVKLPPIRGLVLMIPALVHIDCYAPVLAKLKDVAISSFETCKDAPVLPRKVCRLFMDLLKVKEVQALDEADVRLNPGNATPEQVKGLPPTTFGIAGFDPLRDEGLLFAQMLTEAGVPTDVNLFKGVPHGFRRYGDQLSECERWDRVVERGVEWALAGPEATGVFEIKTE